MTAPTASSSAAISQSDQDVTGLDALAASVTTLEDPYAFHGRLLRRSGTWCR